MAVPGHRRSRLPLGAEQPPQHPTETESAEGSSNESHRSSVGSAWPAGFTWSHGAQHASIWLGRPAVLLLHGLSSAGPVWWRIGDARAAGYSSVAPDLRGHGDSAHPGEYSLDGYAMSWRRAPDRGNWSSVTRSVAPLPCDRPRSTRHSPRLPADRSCDRLRSHRCGDRPLLHRGRSRRPAERRTTPGRASALGPQGCRAETSALLATSVDVIDRSSATIATGSSVRDLASITVPVHILGAADEPLYTADHFASHGLGTQR